jgi:hypothetical protein
MNLTKEQIERRLSVIAEEYQRALYYMTKGGPTGRHNTKPANLLTRRDKAPRARHLKAFKRAVKAAKYWQKRLEALD